MPASSTLAADASATSMTASTSSSFSVASQLIPSSHLASSHGSSSAILLADTHNNTVPTYHPTIGHSNESVFSGSDNEEFDYESLPNSSMSVNLLAGAFAGITEHIVTYPMDAIKTRMQFISSAQVYSSLSRSLARVYTTEGFGALWRGVSSVTLGAGPSHALYFSVYEHFKDIFHSWDNSTHQHMSHAAAGVLATVAHDGFATPFDVVKQRMQMSAGNMGLFATGLKVFRTEGIGAFFISYPTTLMMSIPYQSIQFSTYEYVRKMLSPTTQYDPLSHVMAGGAAGATASIITNPLDVAKTLLQTRGINSDLVLRRATGLGDAFRIIYQHDGLVGFTRGMQARVLANAPATAICWTTYEFLKRVISTTTTSSTSKDSSRE
ncbi:hypothetical protein BASA50_003788 [Batrachochytrium salamandrivorans]|uniref:Mitochondrial thiamine pyrophosphate carrier 1 n=1 Tax=Batrachochytrium salamandrivorans TaxID=1357716 RepID=A0ABQ8FKA0_9FUNG|nr:hypothetical protein BASA60_005565 [Batrachochytrium salamandrivorans]KAH6574878.1 hypothetical protein BASA62_002243 [Batrachochytrium salamandrivorans]KAH6583963.1 hypothetical protein BASA61_007725 [Batrachochytrium salamandrivorans]KAH6598367.1 hypothetical protein BASA50_003788 [Batrachochytrium salamandrivorans]KAH9245303.1 hypothetical protein BASA81_017233 [Batrachochytrium salamandrivorans]